jgi:hypothetical protein
VLSPEPARSPEQLRTPGHRHPPQCLSLPSLAACSPPSFQASHEPGPLAPLASQIPITFEPGGPVTDPDEVAGKDAASGLDSAHVYCPVRTSGGDGRPGVGPLENKACPPPPNRSSPVPPNDYFQTRHPLRKEKPPFLLRPKPLLLPLTTPIHLRSSATLRPHRRISIIPASLPPIHHPPRIRLMHVAAGIDYDTKSD